MVDYTSVVSHTSTHFFKRKGNLIFWVAFSIVRAKINKERIYKERGVSRSLRGSA